MTCLMTMSDNGRNGSGVASYWRCGKPAKFVLLGDRLHPDGLPVCGLHAHHLRKYVAARKTTKLEPVK